MSDWRQRIANLSPEELARLEAALQQKTRAGSGGPTIQRRKSADPSRLSFAQERLWFLDQFEPQSPVYNICRAVHLEGPLDRSALQKALNEVVARHESLRTVFRSEDGIPFQVVTSDRTVALDVVELSDQRSALREDEVQHLLRRKGQHPFVLSRDLMLRATLLRLHEEEHWLLLVMHHIASDGWSVGVLFRDLAALYDAFSKGRPSPLPELPIQYADFAQWQREWLQGEVLAQQLSHWKKSLAGAPAVLQLPIDHPRPDRQTVSGARQVVLFPERLTESLRLLSRREGATLFMTLLAALQALLHRYTGQTDICTGTAIANRTKVEMEPLIGFFVNTLALRADLSGDPSFRQLLSRVKELALEAYMHPDLPFEKLVEALHPARSLSYSPLFQLLFVLQNSPVEALRLPGLSSRTLEIETGTAKFDLTLSLEDSGPKITGWLEYNTDLFGAETVRRMMGHYQTLLEAVVQDPDERITALPILTDPERRQLLVEWNDTKREYPDSCVHELFEAQVRQTPRSVAIMDENTQLTYQELNARANQLARHLRKLGVGPEVLVGIGVERSVEMVVGLLGILKAGGTYVPLDPVHPKERLAFMVGDSGLKVLLSQEHLRDRWSWFQGRLVCLDSDWEAARQEGPEDLRSGVEPNNLAYVTYTSGSTGVPKGVQISHRALVNFLVSMQAEPGITANDTVLAVTTLTFDIAGLEIYLPLSVGARVVLASRETATDGRRLQERLLQSGASLVQATPALWRLLVDSGWHGGKALKILCGGEAMPGELARELITKASSVWNMYGPTETTVWSTVFPVTSADRPIPIGKPIANTEIYVLDKHLQPSPVGVAGELHIGGDGLARGYLNRPELTAEKFIPHPFSQNPGACLYKTGDLVRYLPDGNLDFLGRLDDQVKIRGFRIELGEIEAVLAEHPEVKAAAVVAREDACGDKRLVAYIVPEKSRLLTGDTLRGFLKRKLPDYMLPSRFEFLESLPLTPNRKVDRRALPAPDSSRPEAAESFVAPRSELEEKLARIWTELLRLEQVGVHDNFFDLGGHSLLAVKLIARIEQVLGERVALVTLFQAPTIRELAAILSGQNQSALVPGVVPIHAAGSRAPFFWVGATPRYRPLAQRLAAGQPFLGLHLQPSQVSQLAVPYRLEELAACLVKTVRAVQPEGLYYLGGFCLNGVLAYETARQLRARGENIALLLLFDARNPACQRAAGSSQASTFVPRLRHHLANLRQLEMKQVPAYLLTRLRWFVDSIKARIWKTAYGLRLYMGNGQLSDPDQIREVAGRAYQPPPYAGRVVFFQTTKRPVGPRWNLISGWRELVAGALDVHDIPGDHESVFFGQELEYLASQMTACLREAQAAWDRSQ